MLGTRETIPANRMIEIPLPMPFSLICSPSHINQRGTGGEHGQHDDHSRKDAHKAGAVIHQDRALAAEQEVVGDGLDQAQGQP